MMATDTEDDFVLYGTPLEREEDLPPSKRKQALAQGNLRTLSPWNQEVFDENGRRRFHGAFTGGFSAGYYNTVGSKEGWAPQSFTSSRKKRAELVQKTAYDFMDEDEKEAEHDYARLGAVSEFDTFGFTAAEYARQEAARELQKRPSIIPGLPPDEIIVPVSDSIGFKLLLKMGWRHGRAIGPSHIAASSEIRRQGRKAMLALAQSNEGETSKEKMSDLEILSGLEHTNQGEVGITEDSDIVPTSTPVYVIHPKHNRHGFGFDPHKGAPEFRGSKRPHLGEDLDNKSRSWTKHHDIISRPSLFRPDVGRMGSGFGIGALEELDEDDEDIYAPGAEMETVSSDDEVHPSSFKGKKERLMSDTKHKALPGFKRSLIPKFKMEWFPPPVVPMDFVAVHKFQVSLDSERDLLRPEPAKVCPPEDTDLCKMIEGLAKFVARSGQKLENFYMEKKTEDPMFAFLFGGNGHAYYKWKCWEEQRKVASQGKGQNSSQNAEVLDSVQRGTILGEIPLDRKLAPSIGPEDRARLQSALSSTFTKSIDEVDNNVPKCEVFKGNPAKQARFEQFLKDKFQGGLRAGNAVGGSSLTELERAQETLEFEAACHNLQASGSTIVFNASTGLFLQNLQAVTGNCCSSQISDKEVGRPYQEQMEEKYPEREEHQWRPVPLLCKRFNLPDPYLGKPPPLPKPRSRTDSFILLSNPTTTGLKTLDTPQKKLTPMPETGDVGGSSEQDTAPSSVNEDSGHETPVQIFEKPVDLYKAIFSDDSEEEDTDFHAEPKSEDKTAEAAHAALNRLEAGDFLASLGKELGLKVPPQESHHTRRGKETLVHPGGVNVSNQNLLKTQDTWPEDKKQHANVITQIAGTVSQHSVRDFDQAAGMVMEFSSCGAVEDEELLRKISKTASFRETSQEPMVTSVLQHNYSDDKGQKRKNKFRKSPSKGQLISKDSSSEDGSDSYERKRQEHKSRKTETKDSSRHKRRNEKRDKERKSDKHHNDGSYEHQHYRSRKHHRSHGSDNKSSGV